MRDASDVNGRRSPWSDVGVRGESRPESSGPANERRLMQVACGGGDHVEWVDWEQRARVRGSWEAFRAKAADNAWAGVWCAATERARVTVTRGGGREASKDSASPTAADPGRDRVGERGRWRRGRCGAVVEGRVVVVLET